MYNCTATCKNPVVYVNNSVSENTFWFYCWFDICHPLLLLIDNEKQFKSLLYIITSDESIYIIRHFLKKDTPSKLTNTLNSKRQQRQETNSLILVSGLFRFSTWWMTSLYILKLLSSTCKMLFRSILLVYIWQSKFTKSLKA